jgi:UDP-N-acetylglucosamine:LPS N-acetylglucosamine transferase
MLKLVSIFALIAVVAVVLALGTVATPIMLFAMLLGVAAIFLVAAVFALGTAVIAVSKHRRRVLHREHERSAFARVGRESRLIQQ